MCSILVWYFGSICFGNASDDRADERDREIKKRETARERERGGGKKKSGNKRNGEWESKRGKGGSKACYNVPRNGAVGGVKKMKKGWGGPRYAEYKDL